MDSIEKVGNKLPHPFMLFLFLAVAVLVISFILNKLGVSVTYEAASAAKGAMAKETTVAVRNLFESSFIKDVLNNFVKIYITFKPLGIVMMMMLAIGFIQDTGFFDALMKKTLMKAPTYAITFILAIVGVCSSLATNAGIVFSASVGAVIFSSLKRNPIIGAVAGYVAAHGGFSANLMITAFDTLLSGITASSTGGMHIQAPINPVMNWFFMIAATFVIASVVTVVTEKVLPRYVDIKYKHNNDVDFDRGLSDAERKGLKWSLVAFVLYVALLFALGLPKDSFLRNASGGILPSSPYIKSIEAFLFFFFVSIGVAYGIGAGTIRNQKDIPKFMASGLETSMSYLVVALPAAFFIYFFKASNLAIVLSVKGAAILQQVHFSGIPLVVAFVLLVAFLNLFLTSGSSKWMVLAPIFIPMFSVMGISPALTQLAFRIGDTCTNPITPINYFLPMLIAVISKYVDDEDQEIGIGTVISLTLPYSIMFMICLISMLALWIFLGLPLGPGASAWI